MHGFVAKVAKFVFIHTYIAKEFLVRKYLLFKTYGILSLNTEIDKIKSGNKIKGTFQ